MAMVATDWEAKRAANIAAAAEIKVGDIVRVTITRTLMQAKGWKTRVVEGPVTAVTAKAIRGQWKVTTVEADNCHRCGKDLQRFGSRKIGYGPDCAAYLGIHWPTTSELSDDEINAIRSRIYTDNVLTEEWLPKSGGVVKVGDAPKTVTTTATATPVAPPCDVRITVEELNTTKNVGTFIVLRSPYSKENYERSKSVPGGRWDPEVPMMAPATRPGAWVWAVSDGTARQLKAAWAKQRRRGNAAFLALLGTPEDQAKIAAAVEAKASTALADIPGLNGESWMHQRQAYWFAEAMKSACLDMGMGTGKTRVAVALVQNRKHSKVLIVAPKRVVETVWQAQFERHATGAFHIYRAFKGSVADRAAQARKEMERAAKTNTPFVCVINYQSFWREGFREFALTAGFDLVIYDEIHKIKAPGGKASMFCRELAKKIPYKLGLTGTLTPHSRLDLYSIFRALDPSIFGTSYAAFRNRYADMHPVFPSQVIAWKNEQELQDKTATITYRVTSDILDLPPVQHETVPVTIGKRARDAYNAMYEDMCAEVDAETSITASNALSKLLRLQQIACGYLKLEDGTEITVDDAKRETLQDLLEDLPANEPVVVFYRFHHDAVQIREAVTNLDRRYAELSGRKLRTGELGLNEWLAGEADVIAVQIQSGEAGIDLTRAAYCIYYSLDFNLANYDQSLKRVDRPGQTRPVRYYHLVAADTVDAKIYAALAARKDDVTAFLKALMAGED